MSVATMYSNSACFFNRLCVSGILAALQRYKHVTCAQCFFCEQEEYVQFLFFDIDILHVTHFY